MWWSSIWILKRSFYYTMHCCCKTDNWLLYSTWQSCFVDFSKAFDKVNYWKLFGQLMDDGVNSYIVLLLAYWYSHQQASVIWMNTQSNVFRVGNGTKQSGILSPYLFLRYIRLLLYKICVSKIGCHIGGMAVNVFAYADDVVLLII